MLLFSNVPSRRFELEILRAAVNYPFLGGGEAKLVEPLKLWAISSWTRPPCLRASTAWVFHFLMCSPLSHITSTGSWPPVRLTPSSLVNLWALAQDKWREENCPKMFLQHDEFADLLLLTNSHKKGGFTVNAIHGAPSIILVTKMMSLPQLNRGPSDCCQKSTIPESIIDGVLMHWPKFWMSLLQTVQGKSNMCSGLQTATNACTAHQCLYCTPMPILHTNAYTAHQCQKAIMIVTGMQTQSQLMHLKYNMKGEINSHRVTKKSCERNWALTEAAASVVPRYSWLHSLPVNPVGYRCSVSCSSQPPQGEWGISQGFCFCFFVFSVLN